MSYFLLHVWKGIRICKDVSAKVLISEQWVANAEIRKRRQHIARKSKICGKIEKNIQSKVILNTNWKFWDQIKIIFWVTFANPLCDLYTAVKSSSQLGVSSLPRTSKLLLTARLHDVIRVTFPCVLSAEIIVQSLTVRTFSYNIRN